MGVYTLSIAQQFQKGARFLSIFLFSVDMGLYIAGFDTTEKRADYYTL